MHAHVHAHTQRENREKARDMRRALKLGLLGRHTEGESAWSTRNHPILACCHFLPPEVNSSSGHTSNNSQEGQCTHTSSPLTKRHTLLTNSITHPLFSVSPTATPHVKSRPDLYSCQATQSQPRPGSGPPPTSQFLFFFTPKILLTLNLSNKYYNHSMNHRHGVRPKKQKKTTNIITRSYYTKQQRWGKTNQRGASI